MRSARPRSAATAASTWHWALGFVHAQERYFEMDLMRRAAAGELSELVGAAALPMDKQRRPFRMRARAAQVLAAAAAGRPGGARPPTAMASTPVWLRSARGRGNTGCCSATPKPWTDADSVLVMDAMFFDLQRYDQRARTGLREDPRRAAGIGIQIPLGQRRPVGCATARSADALSGAAAAGRHRSAQGRSETAARSRRQSRPNAHDAGQQQLCRQRRADFDARRARRQRHAPEPARAEHLVSRAPDVSEPAPRRRERST